jgi:hypothetical protein
LARLRWPLASSASNSIYNQLAFSGPIFLLFLTQLQIDAGGIGVLLSIFPFCMLLALAAGPWAARHGVRRVFIAFGLMRTLALSLMLAVPLLAGVVGGRVTFLFVAAVLVAFSLLRAVVVTAGVIWNHQIIPAAIRGRYTAADSILVAICGAGAMTLAGLFLGQSPGTARFVVLFALAAGFGIVACLLMLPVHGGGAAQTEESSRGIVDAMRDRAFVLYLAWSALLSVGWTAASAFAPLLFLDMAGLSAGRIVVLESVLMWSGLVSTWAWGVMADRCDIRRMLMLTTAGVGIYPLGLLLLPASGGWAYPMALTLMALVGAILPGWGIAQMRYLYVRAVPAHGRGGYLGLSTAVGGCVQGLTMIGAGFLIEWARHWPPLILADGIELHRFWPVLALSLASLSGGAMLLAFSVSTPAAAELQPAAT